MNFRVSNRQYNCWLSVMTINCVSSTLMVIALTFPKDLSEGNLTKEEDSLMHSQANNSNNTICIYNCFIFIIKVLGPWGWFF
ncbi:hypothetical protein S83_023265 [Arachis hypogaea]